MAFLINYFNKIGKIRGDEWNLWSKSMYIFWTDNLSKSALEGTFGKRVNVNENTKSQEIIITYFIPWKHDQPGRCSFLDLSWEKLSWMTLCPFVDSLPDSWLCWSGAVWRQRSRSAGCSGLTGLTPDCWRCWSSTEVSKLNIAAKISVCPCATLYIEYIMHI